MLANNQRIPQNQNPSSRGSSISDKQEMLTKKFVNLFEQIKISDFFIINYLF